MKKCNAEREYDMYMLKSFLSNVNKLVPGRRTASQFGIVTCKRAADHTRGRVGRLNRTGYGTRLFSLSKSDYAASGKYTLGKLREKLTAAVA